MNVQVYEDDWWERVGQYITEEQFQAIWDAAKVAPEQTQQAAE